MMSEEEEEEEADSSISISSSRISSSDEDDGVMGATSSTGGASASAAADNTPVALVKQQLGSLLLEYVRSRTFGAEHQLLTSTPSAELDVIRQGVRAIMRFYQSQGEAWHVLGIKIHVPSARVGADSDTTVRLVGTVRSYTKLSSGLYPVCL